MIYLLFFTIQPASSVCVSLYRFYRAMHFSAKRGLAIACRLSVCDVSD